MKHRPSIRTLVLLLLIVGGSMLVAHSAYAVLGLSAGEIATSLKGLAADLLNAILSIVRLGFFALLGLLLKIGGYNNFLESPVVQVGWVLVRDVANLFFILMLLGIAFSTIMGSEKLSIKTHLIKLLLMALFINFSKMISGIMIDFSQVFMLTFANAIQGSGGFAANIGVLKMNEIRDTAAVDFWGLLLNTVLGIIFIVLASLVVGAAFVLLLARILALWILVTLSPFAFALSAIPQLQKYASQWWEQMAKNLTSGPVLMFFLWLAFSVQDKIQHAFSGYADIKTGVGPSQLGTADSLVTFAVSLGLLMVGINIAVSAGGAGASAVGAVASKGKEFGTKIAKGGFGASWAASHLAASTGIELRPGKIIEAFKGTMEHKKKEREMLAEQKVAERVQVGGIGAALAIPASQEAQRLLFQGSLKEMLQGKGLKAVFGKQGFVRAGGDEARTRYAEEIQKLDYQEARQKEQLAIAQKAGSKTTEEEGGEAGIKGTFGAGTQLERAVQEGSNDFMQALGDTGQLSILHDTMSRIEGRGWSPEEEKKQKDAKLSEYVKNLDDDELEDVGLNQENARSALMQFLSEKDKQKADTRLRQWSREKTFSVMKESGFNAQQHIELTTLGTQSLTGEINVKSNELKDVGKEIAKLAAVFQKASIDAENVSLPKAEREKAEQLKQKTLTQLQAAQGKEKSARVEVESLTMRRDHPEQIADTIKQATQKLDAIEVEKNKQSDNIRRTFGPVDYEALAGRRELVKKEEDRIQTTNDDELVSLWKSAKESGDAIRAMAIASRAAKVSHLNEIVGAEGFDSNVEGLHALVNNVFKKNMGLTGDAALAFENDLSNSAEKVGHWMFGQAVGVKNGKLEQRSMEEQLKRADNEMRKKGIQSVLRDNNRLAWGTEKPIDPSDPSKGREWTPGPHFLQAIAENIDRVVFQANRGEKTFNDNLLLKIGENPRTQKILLEFAEKSGIKSSKGDSIKSAMEIILRQAKLAAKQGTSGASTMWENTKWIST